MGAAESATPGDATTADAETGAAAGGLPTLGITGGIATLTLNRPRHMNRIEPADLAEIIRLCGVLDADPAVRVVVITGTGRAFSAGYHLGDLATRDPDAPPATDDFETMVDRVEALRAPTICKLNGGAYGGATDLALACDFRLGHEGVEMFMPAARLGVHYYASGLRRYVSRLGLNAAKRLFLTAERLDAQAMLEIGYLTELAPREELDARAAALATRIADLAPLAVQGVKRALNEIAHGTLDAAALADRVAQCKASADLQEGLAAFRAKRDPIFQGR
jgi:enoyl-CoA hydratase/carnithine racemase